MMGYDVEDGVEAGDSRAEELSQEPYVITEDCGKGRKQKVIVVPNSGNCRIRVNSAYLLLASPPMPYYVGYVSKLILDDPDNLQAKVVWYYRCTDLADKGLPTDGFVASRATFSRCKSETGKFKELLMSNHEDITEAVTFVHEIKVWTLPGEDLRPVSLGGAGDGAASGGLLPGFVCRRFLMAKNDQNKVLWNHEAQKDKRILKQFRDDVTSMLRRTELELPVYKRRWLDRRARRGRKRPFNEGLPGAPVGGSGEGGEDGDMVVEILDDDDD